MTKTAAYTLLAMALVAGVALGYVATTQFGPKGGDGVRNASLRVGDIAPGFRLPDHTGGYVRLGDYQGKTNVVIAFYPLAWTPV